MVRLGKKIALVIYGMLGGGIETFLINLGQFLRSQGMDVTVITTEVQGAWFERLAQNGIKAKHINGLKNLFPTEHLIKMTEILRSDGYNAILSNHARYAQAAVDRLASDTVFIPILHGDEEVFFNLSCYNASFCNCIITVSPKLTNALAIKKPHCPIITIPNGVKIIDIGQFEQRTFYERQLRLIYVGRLRHEEKGVLFLPSILRKIKNMGMEVFLDVVGDGNDCDELVRLFKSEDVSELVHMRGMLDSKEIYQLLCKSHFLLFPSFNKEGLPLVPIEAQMCGCIPIASRLPGSTDVIVEENKSGVLVNIGDVNAIAETVVKLWENKDKVNQMSIEAIHYSRAKFSVEAMGNQYYNLIRDALNGKYPLKTERKNLLSAEELNPGQLLDKYFDILFISGTINMKKMYRFWMEQLIIKQKPISEVLYKSGIRRVAIFGTLKNALYLTKDLSMAGIEVLCYLENNPEMQGKELCQLSVNSSSWLAQNKEAVDAVVISIESESDIIVKEQLQKITINDIKVLTWKELVQLNGFN